MPRSDATANALAPADREVGARGLDCPLPILRTRKALNDMASGQTIRVPSTDPASVRDVPRSRPGPATGSSGTASGAARSGSC